MINKSKENCDALLFNHQSTMYQHNDTFSQGEKKGTQQILISEIPKRNNILLPN